MRVNPMEINGSRVRLRYAVELHYDVDGPSEFLLNVHAARTPHQRVLAEAFAVSPARDVQLDEDPFTGNRICAFGAASGTVVARYSATVEVAHRIVDPSAVVAETPMLLLGLSRSAFQNVLAAEPAVAVKLLQYSAGMLRRTEHPDVRVVPRHAR